MIDDLLSLVGDISMPVKVAWIVWLAWASVLIVWYRRGRTEMLVPQPLPRQSSARAASSSSVRPVSSSSVKRPAAARAGGSPEFLAALGLDEPQETAATPPPSRDDSVYT